MTFSPARALVATIIGLPVGFVLAALAFAVSSRAIEAPALAPFAVGIAVACGLITGFRTHNT